MLFSECILSPFVGGSTSQQIPFVYLPLRGQIIHPGKAISLSGIHTPICAVSGAKYMTEDGWVDLRNAADSDVPFRLVRDQGRAFLQWSGDAELRSRMSGRLIMVNMMCREMSTTESMEIPRVQIIFSPCVAFRVVGSPMKHLTNVSEVAFAQDSQTESSSITSESMSVSEYVAIGICSVLLGLIYVASVFLYLHLRRRNRSDSSEKSDEDKSIRGIEEGVVKSNPLLSMPTHFIQGETAYSDTNSSDNDAAPDIIKHYEDRKKQITSALVHPQNQKFGFNSHRSTFSTFEYSHQDSATNERLPEENVSIVETLEGREDRPDNIKALVAGQTDRDQSPITSRAFLNALYRSYTPMQHFQRSAHLRLIKNLRGYSTPSDYADVSSSQPSPSLSTVLPDQEEMTMRNAIFNKRTGNLTMSKINMDVLQEDDHDYELIVMKKGSIVENGCYKLPELLQGNNSYSLVSEVYVNSGYNYGSAPSTPGGSRYSTLDKNALKVRYENGVEKPGKLLIEVEDCLDHYIPVHDSDEFEADTLDRKPSKNKIPDCSLKSQDTSLEHPTRILLKTTGSFRSDSTAVPPPKTDPPRNDPPEESNFNRAFGSLREIYEAKTKRGLVKEVDRMDCCTVLGEEEKGRTLTLEDRHSRRQRAKGAIVQPDVIPPPPHGGSPVYERTRASRDILDTDDNLIKPSHYPKNSNGRSVGNTSTRSSAPTCGRTSVPSGTPDHSYELFLLQKSKKNGTIIHAEDVVLKKKRNPRAWNATMKPEDSGYLSSESNESRSIKTKATEAVDNGSETDESLGDGHSESGAESVETNSVFFGRFPRNMALFRGYGSADSGVMGGGDEGQSSSDSENISYTTVIPVKKT
nr:uncharacterized protein LOC111515188 [Leptinotarsa decemlineata]